jgi:hypothetical protein
MKAIVQRAYGEAIRETETARRAANVATVAERYANANARDMSRREYTVMRDAFLRALRGAPVS